MATFANVTPTAIKDGIVYAANVPLTTTEADLYNGVAVDGQDPVQVQYGQAIQAIVQVNPQDIIGQSNSYVVMQTDLGDGVWVDVAWCVAATNGISKPRTFTLAGGSAGANAFEQTRAVGQFPTPQANGSNQIPLGGRIRFVGKGILSGGSSSSPGRTANVIVNITYKLLGLR